MTRTLGIVFIGALAIFPPAGATQSDAGAGGEYKRLQTQPSRRFRGTLGPYEAHLRHVDHSSKRFEVTTPSGNLEFIITKATTFVVDNDRAGSEYDLREGQALGIDWVRDEGSTAVAEHVRIFTQRGTDPPPRGTSSSDIQARVKADMEAYTQLAQPGEHHKRLSNLAGRWKTTSKTWMSPGQPPIEVSGTIEASWILGGRYIQGLHTGSFMGQPFEGRSLDGYDNVTREYFSTWIDNMGTGVMFFRGSCDDPCKVLTETAEGPDPMTGKVLRTRNVITFIDRDTYRSEMYAVGVSKDGQDAKVMDMIATREK